MRIRFTKMHGIGNDYVYINCFEQTVKSPGELAVSVSDRRFGIGSDGLILICPSDVADARMKMYNADGSEGKMCGNGIRCVGKYLYENGIVKKEAMTVETKSGIKHLNLSVENGSVKLVTVDMGEAVLDAARIPVHYAAEKVVNMPLSVGGTEYRITCVSMGNPHCVIFCDHVAGIPLEKIGPCFENFPVFPEQVNTEFVQVVDRQTIKMRVWERGSGETLSCGTGSCASVVASVLNGKCDYDKEIKVILRGGELKVKYCLDGRVFMTGTATKVFDGEIEVGGGEDE